MYSVKKKIRKRNMQLSGIFLLGIIVCALFILLNDSEFCDYLFTQKDLSRYELDMVKEGKCYVYDNNLLMDCIGEADSKRLYVSPITNDLGETNYVGLYVSQDDYGLADDILQKSINSGFSNSFSASYYDVVRSWKKNIREADEKAWNRL